MRLGRASRTAISVALLAAGFGCASARPIPEGEPFELEPDEGLLVVHVRSNRWIEELEFSNTTAARGLASGEQLRLVAVEAGRHFWAEATFRDELRFRLTEIEDPGFRVEAGRLNFVGMLELERVGLGWLRMRSIDRTAAALELLEPRFPGLLSRYPAVYSGPARHVFLERYLPPMASPGAGQDDREASPAAARGRFVPAGSFVREPAIERVVVSPGGSFLALYGFEEEHWWLWVEAVPGGASTSVYRQSEPLHFGWVDDDSLLVASDDTRHVLELSQSEAGSVEARYRTVRALGRVVDYLPRVPDRVLWSSSARSWSLLHRVPTDELVDPGGAPVDRPSLTALLSGGSGLFRQATRVHPRYRVAAIRDPVWYWISDREGVPRAAMVVEDEETLELELRYREGADDSWRTVGAFEGDDFPLPVGMAPDGGGLLVLSAEGRDTRALRRYRVDEERLGEVLWSDPLYDPVDVVWDYQGDEVIAVVTEEEGMRRHHPVSGVALHDWDWIEESFPGRNLRLTSRSEDGRFATVFASASDDPGFHYLLDRERRQVIELGAAMPWLDPRDLVPVERLAVESADGLPIESFFAAPRHFAGERPPLVVMPHGGPIGVRDSRDFHPMVQYLASAGYAVLQPNYRGSSGLGERFREAGLLAWGTAIEDDVEAAVAHVIAQGRVDPERVCIFGWSYGGYSALMSVVRHPARYRCAAAVAAPSDLLLMFDSSDFAATAAGRRGFAKIVGHPDRDRGRLVRTSPAYRAAEVDVPVLLVHGDADRRVDVEHAHRMRAMLAAHGKPYVLNLVKGMSHGGVRSQQAYVLRRVRRFLDEHLGERAGRSGEVSPEPEADLD